jgi:transposase
MVLYALQGQTAPQIARLLRCSRRTVQRWVYGYRDHGMAGLEEAVRCGKSCRLTEAQQAKLRERLDRGPLPEDGVCTFRGKDIARVIQCEFGVVYSLNGVYQLLHALDYSSLKPRPRHNKNDPQAVEQFRQGAPLLSRP